MRITSFIVVAVLALASPRHANASAETVTILATAGFSSTSVVVRRSNGSTYLLDFGIGCLATLFKDGANGVVDYPGSLYIGVGKFTVSGSSQQCTIWDAKLLPTIVQGSSGSTTIITVQGDGRGTYHIFPQFADGRFSDGSYYRATLMYSEPTALNTGTCTFNWAAGGKSILSGQYSFGPSAWQIDSTPGSAAFTSGYATLSCSSAINAHVLYSFYAPNGHKLSEATVFPSLPGRVVQLLADHRDGARLGIAIANDNTASQTIAIAVWENGQSVTRSHTLSSKSNLVGFIDELTAWRGTAGQVIIDCPSQCAAIGLRFTGASFTTIPATIRLP